MTRKYPIVSLALGALHLGGSANDADLRAARLAANCANCHGTDCVSAGGRIPGLAGKSKETIITLMQDFKTGARRATLLHPFSKIVIGGLLALLLGAGFGAQAFAGDQIKVVYHIADGGDQAMRALGNIRNHLHADPDVKIIVVALADGIKFLLDGSKDRNGHPFNPEVTALAAQGVEFRVCNNTLTAHNIPASRVVAAAKIVPSGAAEVARLQAKEGFVYLRP